MEIIIAEWKQLSNGDILTEAKLLKLLKHIRLTTLELFSEIIEKFQPKF
jgi:hypothetical protein